MIVTATRGTQEWREAHRRHVTASDMPELFAKRGSKTWASLVERLVLDFEGVPQHTDEHPDPWAEQHEIDVTAAVARYHRAVPEARIERVGFLRDDLFTWLGASPHALVDDDGCLYVRIRKRLKSWHEKHAKLDRATLGRLHVTMRVAGRSWCDVVDWWDAPDDLDKISRQRVPYSSGFFLEEVVPRCVLLWQEVSASRRLRARASHC